MNKSIRNAIGFGSARFVERSYLPQGLNGIIVSNDAIIGKQCQVYHQVTIGSGNGGSPVIWDNVLIGAGCVVTIDVPGDATVVMDKPRIILHRN